MKATWLQVLALGVLSLTVVRCGGSSSDAGSTCSAGQCPDGGGVIDSGVSTGTGRGSSSGGREASTGGGSEPDSNAGQCLDPGQTACGKTCTNLKTDSDNCGSCGAVCSTGACFNGFCVCTANQTQCMGACTDTQLDDNNCGTCGTACVAGQSCTSGTCACPSGQASCGNGCTNELTDNANCGGCGNSCQIGRVCAAGTCQATCGVPLALCGTTCSDPTTDASNCGTCGNACGPYQNATAAYNTGECGFTCRSGYLHCSGATGCETNALTDVNNCGSCGNGCPTGSTCNAGSCQGPPLTVATGTTVIDTTVTSASGTAGSATVDTGSASGFVERSLVFLHQSQAATGPVGFYEFARVASVSGATLTLTAPLANTYVTDATDAAQVVLVPEYGTATVAEGATLTAPPWNGATGGILVFDAQGTLTVAGSIVMDGQGFRGTSHPICGTHCVGAISGESQLGLGAEGPGTVGGPANGAGGAGGSQGQDCGEGGGGGYGALGSPGGVRTLCGNCQPSGCSTGIPDGTGGSEAGDADLADAVLFGGAGGEGGIDEDGGQAGFGGNGGGLIFIRANTVNVSPTGLVSSAGTAGGNGTNDVCGGGCGMGGGGGGAGGAIRLVASVSAAVGASQLVVSGAGGGTCTCGGGGDGGGGSVGRIGILAAAGVSGTTSPAFDPE